MMFPPSAYNFTPSVPRPAQGLYRLPSGQMQPVTIQAVELSGVAHTPAGPVPFNRVRLNPAATTLSGRCACPMQWQVFPTHLNVMV